MTTNNNAPAGTEARTAGQVDAMIITSRELGVNPFTRCRPAFAQLYQRIPIGFAPELTAVCPGGNLLHEYPTDPTEATRFLERYAHLEVFVGAEIVPCGGTEYHPWANCFRIEARGVRPEHKRFAEQAGAAVLVSEVESTDWLSETDYLFVHGSKALYAIFTHRTLKDLERSLARLVREKVSIRVEQAMNHETPVHFSVQPAPCFPAPQSLSDLALDLVDLGRMAA